MNPILTAFGAAAAVAKLASTAYYSYSDHFGEAQTRSVEVAENQSLDVGFLLNKIPVFDGSGYGIWSSMMRSLFLSQDLWDMVEGGYVEEELTVEVLREVRKKDAWALLFIQQTIDASVFSCISGAKKSKEAWDALQKKYQGDDAEEPSRQNPVDELVLSCSADATQCKEAWDALGMESQEPNQNKAVDESVLSCAADATEPKEAAWDAPEQGYRADTKVVEANRIGILFGDFNNCGFKEGFSANSSSDDWGFKMDKAESAFHSKLKLSEDGIGEESGDIKNNNCGSKKGSRGMSNRGSRGGRNGGRFNNNQGGRGGRDVECSYNQGSHGGTDSGHYNNSRGGHRVRGHGHFSNNREGNGVKDHGHSNNNLGGGGGINRECFNNNQGGHGGIESEHFKNNQGGCGGLDDGCFNSKKSHSGGIDGGHFNRGSEASDYNNMNAKFEPKEASNAHALPEGHQAYTELHAQPQVGNLNGGGIDGGNFNRDSEAADFNNMNAKFESKEALNAHALQQGHQAYTVVVDDYQGGRLSIDGGCFSNKDSEFSDYNSKNPNFESVASSSTSVTESKEASDAPHQGHQANTEVKAQPQVGNPCGGKIIINRLDKAIDEEALHAKFSAFGNLVSCKVARDASGQSKGKGYLEYDSEEAALKAIRKVNGRLLNDKKVYVGPLISKQKVEKINEMTKSTNVYVGNLSEAQPQAGNPCGGKIIINGLDKAIDDKALHAKFSAFGNLVSCKVIRDASGQSKGKGYMKYDSEEAAQKAIWNVNGRLLNDKKVYVGPVVNKHEGEKVMEMTKFTNVYVGNLSESTTEEDLRKVFDYFGTIVCILVMRDGDGKSKGFGFVNFKDADDAAWCMQVLNGHKFDNKEWCVRRATHNKLDGKAQKKPVDEYVPSSLNQKNPRIQFLRRNSMEKRLKKKCLDESVPSFSANATESKKAGEAVQKGNRANTGIHYVDNNGVTHFKLKSP